MKGEELPLFCLILKLLWCAKVRFILLTSCRLSRKRELLVTLHSLKRDFKIRN